MNIPAFIGTLTTRAQSLPIVILYLTAGCNLRCLTCSYRDPMPNELTTDEYRVLSHELALLGLRHVVYSGGEPLLRKDLPEICEIFREKDVHQSMLTNGLLLEKRTSEISPFLRELIVSLDGPDGRTHNGIRGVECFDQILKGVRLTLSLEHRPIVSIRYVVQKRNFRMIDRMVEFARDIGADRISFLAVDSQSTAFHRDVAGPASSEDMLLSADECREFRSLVDRFRVERQKEFRSGFISESPRKMVHMVEYFEALQGGSSYPVNLCNAPMVSTVITSTGELLPCYFLPSYGNIRSGLLKHQINGDEIRKTRGEVRNYSLDQCHKCVCTLHISPSRALKGDF